MNTTTDKYLNKIADLKEFIGLEIVLETPRKWYQRFKKRPKFAEIERDAIKHWSIMLETIIDKHGIDVLEYYTSFINNEEYEAVFLIQQESAPKQRVNFKVSTRWKTDKHEEHHDKYTFVMDFRFNYASYKVTSFADVIEIIESKLQCKGEDE